MKDIKKCYIKPTPLYKWPHDCNYIMFVDENNINNALITVKNRIIKGETVLLDEKYFTITGCIFSRKNYGKAKNILEELKIEYFNDLNICFHSYEIRNRRGSFRMEKNKYNSFKADLKRCLTHLDYTAISITINIEDYFLYTKTSLDLYNIAFNFLLERYVYFIGSTKKTGIIMFESRGKKEDTHLLNHISQLMNVTGTEFIKVSELNNKIKGVFFNPKYTLDKKRTFIGLEVADLTSYPLHKFIKYGYKDEMFEIIEKKLKDYPNYVNKGLKVYPNKK